MTEIQVPQQMVQQLLRGPMPAQKPPDVVEVMSQGERFCFNMDAVEAVSEHNDGFCEVRLKGWTVAPRCEQGWIHVDMTYDEFLYATKIQPRQLYAEADTGD